MTGIAGDPYPEKELPTEGQDPEVGPQRPRIEPSMNGEKSMR